MPLYSTHTMFQIKVEVRSHKLGEVQNEYTPEKLVLFAMPKIFTIGQNLTKF